MPYIKIYPKTTPWATGPSGAPQIYSVHIYIWNISYFAMIFFLSNTFRIPSHPDLFLSQSRVSTSKAASFLHWNQINYNSTTGVHWDAHGTAIQMGPGCICFNARDSRRRGKSDLEKRRVSIKTERRSGWRKITFQRNKGDAAHRQLLNSRILTNPVLYAKQFYTLRFDRSYKTGLPRHYATWAKQWPLSRNN